MNMRFPIAMEKNRVAINVKADEILKPMKPCSRLFLPTQAEIPTLMFLSSCMQIEDFHLRGLLSIWRLYEHIKSCGSA